MTGVQTCALPIYTPGDDPRYLDWGLYGRSDRYYIRKFEDETNLRCQLVVDRSKSMTFGSGSITKDRYASTLAATLAYFLHSQGDAVGLLTFDERVREYLPPRHKLSHLRQLMLALEKPAEGKATSLTDPLDHLVELVNRRGMFVYISDFLAPIERLEASLLALTAGRHEVAVVQILDPSELSLNFGAASLFEDIESGKTLYIEPAAARKAYLPKIAAHNTAVRRTCEKLGVGYVQLTTGAWMTPKGTNIQEAGITPETVVEPARVVLPEDRFPRRTEATLRGALDIPAGGPVAAATERSEEDYQLARAFDLLHALALVRQLAANN